MTFKTDHKNLIDYIIENSTRDDDKIPVSHLKELMKHGPADIKAYDNCVEDTKEIRHDLDIIRLCIKCAADMPTVRAVESAMVDIRATYNANFSHHSDVSEHLNAIPTEIVQRLSVLHLLAKDATLTTNSIKEIEFNRKINETSMRNLTQVIAESTTASADAKESLAAIIRIERAKLAEDPIYVAEINLQAWLESHDMELVDFMSHFGDTIKLAVWKD